MSSALFRWAPRKLLLVNQSPNTMRVFADHLSSGRVDRSHIASMTFTIPFLDPSLMSKTLNGLASVFFTFNGQSDGIIFLTLSRISACFFQLLLSGV